MRREHRRIKMVETVPHFDIVDALRSTPVAGLEWGELRGRMPGASTDLAGAYVRPKVGRHHG